MEFNQNKQLLRYWTKTFLQDIHVLVLELVLQAKETTMNDLKTRLHNYALKDLQLVIGELEKASVLEQFKRIQKEKDKKRDRKNEQVLIRVNGRFVDSVSKMLEEQFKSELKSLVKSGNEKGQFAFICGNCGVKFEDWQVRRRYSQLQCQKCYSQKIQPYKPLQQQSDTIMRYKAVIADLQRHLSNIKETQAESHSDTDPILPRNVTKQSQNFVHSVTCHFSQEVVRENARLFPLQEEIPAEILRGRRRVLEGRRKRISKDK